MKKSIYKSLLATSALSLLVLTSCDTNESPYNFDDLGGNVIPVNSSITNFDTNEDLDLKIFTDANISIQSISILKDGNRVSDASIISDEKATYNASSLAPYNQFQDDQGNTVDYGVFNVSIVTELSNGKTIDNEHPVTVKKALSLETEVSEIEYKNPYNQPDENGNAVKKEISYDIFTAKASIDEVIVEWKKNSNGTYSDTGNSFNTESDIIDLKTLAYINEYNLQIGDTLYYRVTAKKGSISESIETSVAINTQTTNTAGDNLFSNSNNEFSFSESATAEVTYSASTITSAGSIAFLKLNLSGQDLEDYYSAGDLFMIRDDFNAGSSISSITPLELNDIYLYKILRDGTTFYGMIKIGDIVYTNGNEEVNITYKEGSILE
ncbi:hypothetical protein SAMN04489761_1752 [Tenacibaculum sp. MAR_2009_124]|uniref:hypothetical protein n=1 Tax=Tenacibaculum sp. MAR_2009_124 TaxID=1250059 RepID=UPI000897BD1D|nr:hypothetical protein [Tenacibaculum sp. MAR_2009_124]SEB78220.1 hypothetical protein SAMN04489761_1752 [Tenacibaculum sp. MAR_2009_124]